MVVDELMISSAREHPQNQHMPLNPFMFCLVQFGFFFPLAQSRNSFQTVVLRHFSYCYYCHFLPYHHCLTLGLLCFSMNALQVLWKWNTFTEKVMLAHSGSIRKACGAGKWTNLDHFCHSEQSSDNQRMIFLWSISTLEIFWLKMLWFADFFFSTYELKNMSLCLCAYRYIPKHSHAKNSTQTHTHLGNTPKSPAKRQQQGISVHIDGCMLYVHCYQHIE